MATPTIRAVVEAAIMLAEASPDHVYAMPGEGESARCYYVWDGQPSCIFGQALVREGVPLDTLRDTECHLWDTDGKTGLDHLLPALGIEVQPSALGYLKLAQSEQDTGHEWGGRPLYLLRRTLAAL